MFLRLFFRVLLPAVLGAVCGFFALAFAIENEPVYTTASLAVVSPGLRAAEMVAPARHESIASTMGDFLRISLGVNIAYYFLILACIAYVVDRFFFRRPHSRPSQHN